MRTQEEAPLAFTSVQAKRGTRGKQTFLLEVQVPDTFESLRPEQQRYLQEAVSQAAQALLPNSTRRVDKEVPAAFNPEYLAERNRLAALVGYPVERLPGTPEEELAQQADALRRAFAARAEVLRDCLNSIQVASLLGITRQAVHERFRRGLLIGLKERGDLRFPVWQFDPNSEDGLVPGLRSAFAIVRENGVTPFAALRWLTRESPYLEGMTALAALKAGRAAEVLEIAQTVGVPR